MKINKKEMQTLTLLGVGGTAAAVLYGLGSMFLQKATDNYDLEVPVEIIETSPEHKPLLKLLFELKNYTHHNPDLKQHYNMVVQKIDSFLLINKELPNLPRKADFSDFVQVQVHVKQIRHHLKQIIEKLKKKTPRTAAEVDEIVTKIYQKIQLHLSSLQQKCLP